MENKFTLRRSRIFLTYWRSGA